MSSVSPFKWPVQKLCEKQLLDIDPDDILHNGLYRKCNVYKSGGGYDRFPSICKERLGYEYSNQFVVQLRGCALKCWYCYVTNAGIWDHSNTELISTSQLVKDFIESGLDIFHLMGGSPALYISRWIDILTSMPNNKVFHSDFVLTENLYRYYDLINLTKPNALYAVNIKGITPKNFYENTGVKIPVKLINKNLDTLVDSGINFYLTFTNPDINELPEYLHQLKKRYGSIILKNYFVIDLIEYDAISGNKPYKYDIPPQISEDKKYE